MFWEVRTEYWCIDYSCDCRKAVKEVFLPYFNQGEVLLTSSVNIILLNYMSDCSRPNLCSVYSVKISAGITHVSKEELSVQLLAAIDCLVNLSYLKLHLC